MATAHRRRLAAIRGAAVRVPWSSTQWSSMLGQTARSPRTARVPAVRVRQRVRSRLRRSDRRRARRPRPSAARRPRQAKVRRPRLAAALDAVALVVPRSPTRPQSVRPRSRRRALPLPPGLTVLPPPSEQLLPLRVRPEGRSWAVARSRIPTPPAHRRPCSGRTALPKRSARRNPPPARARRRRPEAGPDATAPDVPRPPLRLSRPGRPAGPPPRQSPAAARVHRPERAGVPAEEGVSRSRVSSYALRGRRSAGGPP